MKKKNNFFFKFNRLFLQLDKIFYKNNYQYTTCSAINIKMSLEAVKKIKKKNSKTKHKLESFWI